jgi:hypothetical protein
VLLEVTPLTRKITAALLVVLMASPAYAIRARKVSTTSYPNCFKMVDSTDHVTAKTGLTITCTRSKNGGSFASCSGSVSEVANGVYCIAGNATDRDTLGPLIFHATGTAADPNDFEIEVVTYDPFLYPDTSATLAAVTTVSTTTTATTCTNLTNAPTAGDFTSTMKTSLNDSTPACSSVSGAVGSVTGNVGGNVAGSVGSVTGLTAANLDVAVSSRLAPTTSGRTLDVSSTGGAGLDWANVEGQTTTVALTNTTIGTVTSVSSVSGETTIVSPVGTGGLLTLVRADDYYVADGTELTWTRDTWPDLTSATSVTLTVRARSDDSVIFDVTDKVASRVTGAGDQTVVFEVGTADTALLTPGRLTGKYDIRAVLSNGHIVTLEVTDPPNSYGGVTVLENQTR